MNEATAAGPAARRVAIDPRIKQRRIEVKRDEGRRRLRYVLAGVAVLSVIGCAIAATRSAMLDVDRVRVSGGAHTSEADVLKAGGLSHRRFMVSLDPHAMAVRIERLPWIRHASVTRRWPGTVAIQLAERRPLAEIPSNDKGFSAVDADGRVLNTSPAADPGLLVVSAGEAPPAPGGAVGPATKAAVEVAAALPDRIRSRVGSIAVVPNGDIELQLRSAPLVRFGPADQIQAKITALTTLFDKANLRGATTIDVRVPGAPILTRSAPSK